MIYVATHHRVENFGATLQAYGLQQYLETIGYENELILLKEDRIKKRHCVKKPHLLAYDSFQKVYKYLHKKEIRRGKRRFKDFCEKYHKTTREYVGVDDLLKNPPLGGIYLSGSDQVFNPLNNKPHFFLQFGPQEIRRISYAASVGVDKIPTSKEEEFRKNLGAFDHISIREENSKELVEKFYGNNVDVNIDPSYLLDKEKWEEISDNSIARTLKKPYILVYVIYKSKWLSPYLKRLRKETKCDIVLISYGSYIPVYHNHYVMDAGPKEFLGLVRNAKMVISSSYHGNVFSTIFQKPFYALVNPDAQSRIMSMLELFGLDDRILTKDTKVDFNLDYSQFEERLIDEINRSKAYFKKALEGKK